ncbi:hypothetical protein ACUY3M_00715 [Corynebacterium suicordis]
MTENQTQKDTRISDFESEARIALLNLTASIALPRLPELQDNEGTLQYQHIGYAIARLSEIAQRDVTEEVMDALKFAAERTAANTN